MSEEEKKAVECLKRRIDFTEGLSTYKIENEAFKRILNLIEKQQKEIEELKEKYNEKDVECRHLMELIKSSSNVEYLVKESK